MTATKDRFFKSVIITAETKLAQTGANARDIFDAEAAIRAKKTERLRALRLAQPVAEIPKKTSRSKPSSEKDRKA
ncbi:hypothetical protein HGP16_26185 [Rhizobium sp. P40RR-XXII]|uniref:hypothetical protein n=1 Tax=Rhizobium sp. P40RR-XXII TaxID=2726739 RepID=UPI0014568853|nr:hypothetical protein [Rhizobium sp. P40RR-XXII]NLS20030.1 hypothetical protein [Rhizobium sp. P40RR-XXII]